MAVVVDAVDVVAAVDSGASKEIGTDEKTSSLVMNSVPQIFYCT